MSHQDGQDRQSRPEFQRSDGRRKKQFRSIKLPRSKPIRILLGVALVVGGILGFLPIVGFWMLPLGLMVLSVDIAWVRRRRRRLGIWWGRRAGRNGETQPGRSHRNS